MAPKRQSRDVSASLANLASKSYVSERGLASILKSVKDNIEILEQSSRSSIKRARDAAVDFSSLEGRLLRRLHIAYEDDPTIGLEFTYVHPVAMLVHASNHCTAFSQLLAEQHRNNPSSPDKPWSLILYSDEVMIGDPLSKAKGSRKVQALYWTLKELGPDAMACEQAWMPLTVLRADVIRPIGGLSVLTRFLMDTFFHDGLDIGKGVKCKNMLLFGKIGMVIQDYDAVKHMLPPLLRAAPLHTACLLICLACYLVRVKRGIAV